MCHLLTNLSLMHNEHIQDGIGIHPLIAVEIVHCQYHRPRTVHDLDGVTQRHASSCHTFSTATIDYHRVRKTDCYVIMGSLIAISLPVMDALYTVLSRKPYTNNCSW